MVIAAIVILYFGAVNAWLSRYAGTCTQNVADHLVGLWIVLGCYAVAAGLLWQRRPGRMQTALLVPLVPVLLWHGAEGVRFAWGVFVQGQSACSLLVQPPFGPDGRETQFAILWLLAGVILPVLICWRVVRSRLAGT